MDSQKVSVKCFKMSVLPILDAYLNIVLGLSTESSVFGSNMVCVTLDVAGDYTYRGILVRLPKRDLLAQNSSTSSSSTSTTFASSSSSSSNISSSNSNSNLVESNGDDGDSTEVRTSKSSGVSSNISSASSSSNGRHDTSKSSSKPVNGASGNSKNNGSSKNSGNNGISTSTSTNTSTDSQPTVSIVDGINFNCSKSANVVECGDEAGTMNSKPQVEKPEPDSNETSRQRSHTTRSSRNINDYIICD